MSGTTTTPNNNNSNSNNNSNKRISEEVVGVGGVHLSKYPRDLSKYLHDDSGVGVSVGVDGSNKISGSSSVMNNEFHASSFDLASDAGGRVLKAHRPGDVVAVAGDKRSPVNVYVGLSDSDKDRGGVVGLESSKEGSNRDLKVENRDVVGKGDKDHESKDGFGDFNKGEVRVDKDVHSVGSGQLNWKESKELHNKGKRYSDVSGGNVDSRNVSRSNVHGVGELGKEGLPVLDEKVYGEGHEAVGENKVVEMKGEEKMKEKDRKRKDLKHREWVERDKERSDRRANVQLGGGSNDGKELTREERETEKWEREKKDLLKDKDKLKEREKDHFKRDAWSGGEREGSNHEKEVMDISGKAIEQDNSTLEHKKLKDPDGCKNTDREAKGAKKERDADIEGDRPEKRIRCSEKEPDDGCVEVEGATERDKEAFGYGVQQRKRMLRPRGSPQVANREPRFRSRTQENEGSEGKAEASTVIYRVGECMQELTKLWKEFESSQGEKTCVNSLSGPTLEIRVPAENVTATNRQVRGGQLWGTDIYTDDSDLVAVLMHTGYCRPTASPPPPAIQEFRAVIRVLPPQDCYVSTLRNNVRSRAWGAAIGCSYRVERCCILKRGGGTIDLEPCLTHTSTVEPTLAPVVVERTMTTRAAASNALRQQRFVREVTIQYNLCNEPWTKYSISAVADKGLKRPLYTSARLKKGEVLYLESHTCRYEICFGGEKMVKATTGIIANQAETERSLTHHVHATNGERTVADGETIVVDVFRWSRCKKPLPQKLMLSTGIPLPLEQLEVIEDNLEWEDIEWSQTGVWIAGKEYPLARVHFLSPN